MHSSIPPEFTLPRSSTSRRSPLLSPVRIALVFLAATISLGTGPLFGAQAPAAPPPAAKAEKPSPTPAATAPSTPRATPSTHRAGHRRAHPGKAQQALAPVKVEPIAVEAAAPELPDWPANEDPDAASVTWDSRGLAIVADNSSLEQILDDISTATGAKVEGMGTDQRIFGSFGPGQARDVIARLLEGSGYNVLLIGDQGEGTPRQIVLSSPHAAVATGAKVGGAPEIPGGNAGNEEENEVEEQPPVPEQGQQAPRNGRTFEPPQPPHN
jgi:hypothetical protein